jgi:hypothetical protein
MTLPVPGNDLDWEFALFPRPGLRTASTEGQMAKKRKRRWDTMPILHPDAAGIDVGGRELHVAVSADMSTVLGVVFAYLDSFVLPSW